MLKEHIGQSMLRIAASERELMMPVAKINGKENITAAHNVSQV